MNMRKVCSMPGTAGPSTEVDGEADGFPAQEDSDRDHADCGGLDVGSWASFLGFLIYQLEVLIQ